MAGKHQTPKEIKAHANTLFTHKKYAEAIKHYSIGIAHHDFRTTNNGNLSPDEILLKQSFFLMRGRAYGNLNKLVQAKKDFNQCIEILDHTKYAYKARLVRAQLKIDTIEHLHLAKMDCNAVINAPKKAIEEETRRKARLQLDDVEARLITLKKRLMDQKRNSNSTSSTSKSSKKAPGSGSTGSSKKSNVRMTGPTSRVLNNLSTPVAKQRGRIMQLNHNGMLPSDEDYVYLVSRRWWDRWSKLAAQSGSEGSGPPPTIADDDADLINIDNTHLLDPKYLKKLRKGNGGAGGLESEKEDGTEEKEEKGKETEKETILEVESFLMTPLRKGLDGERDFVFLNTPAWECLTKDFCYKCDHPVKAYIYKKFDEKRNEYHPQIELYRPTFCVHYRKLNEPKKMVKIQASLQEPLRRIEFAIASYLVCQASFIRLRGGSFDGPIWDESNLLDQLHVLENPNIYVELRLPNGCWPSATIFASMTSAHLSDSYMDAGRDPSRSPSKSNNNNNGPPRDSDAPNNNNSHNNERKDDSVCKDDANAPAFSTTSSNGSKASKTSNKSKKPRDEDKSESTTTTATGASTSDSKSEASGQRAVPRQVCHCCYRMIDHFVGCNKMLPNKEECPITYCSHLHQQEHEAFHLQVFHNPRRRQFKGPRHGVTGLLNLHNSCYMNSSLQCLSWIPELRAYFLSGDFWDDVNQDNPLGYGGKLAELYMNFLRQTWFLDQDVIRPTSMRYQIGRLNETWNTPQQQDAQEFVDWFLDGLHEDTNRVKKKPYYELKDSDGRPDEIVANEAWDLHIKRNQSIIIDTFQGQIKSTLKCPSCDYASVKFDPFSVLQLPIPEREHEQHLPCLVFPTTLQEAPTQVTITVSSKATVQQLIDKIQDTLQIDSSNFLVCKVVRNEFQKYYNLGRSVRYIKDQLRKVKNFHYIYQVTNTTVAQRRERNMIQCRMNFCIRRNNGDGLNDSQYDSDRSGRSDRSSKVHFTFPILFEVNAPLTGNKVYRALTERLKYLVKSREQLEADENMDLNQLPPFPKVSLYVRVGKDEKQSVSLDDESLILTKAEKNVATIDVEISETEYERYMDRNKISKVLRHDPQDGKKRGKKCLDIYDCLELFTASEILEEDVWTCKSCKQKQQASKQLHLWRLPDILIIQLKRFVGGAGIFGVGYGRKLEVPVDFPVRGLDLTRYLSPSQIASLQGAQAKSPTPTATNATAATARSATQSPSSDDASDEISHLIPKYDLCGIVNHHGVMEFGHYTAIARVDNATKITNWSKYYDDRRSTEESRNWIMFNDERVDTIDENRIKSRDAYLLFYRRRTDPNDC